MTQVFARKKTTGLPADRLATYFYHFFSMADEAETPKKVAVESSKCLVCSSPSGTIANERVFIFGNSAHNFAEIIKP